MRPRLAQWPQTRYGGTNGRAENRKGFGGARRRFGWRPRGVEPLPPRSVVWCSIQLSYGRLPSAGRRCAPVTTTPPRPENARRIVAPALAAGCCRNHIARMSPDAIAAHDTAADDPATRPSITLLAGRHRRAEAGHPWIYSNEVVMDT